MLARALLRNARPALLGQRRLCAAGSGASGPDGRAAAGARGGEDRRKETPLKENESSVRGTEATGSQGGDGDKRMSMAEIQALHARKASAPLDPAKRAKISTGKVFRGSDGFLDFEEVPPPWKGREGPYKPIYLLVDANWVLRKSKNADRILGGFSVAFVCCSWGVYNWAPHLMM